MTIRLPISLALVSLLGIAACGGGDPHEELAREGLSAMEGIGDTLAKMTDKASAEQYADELKKQVNEMTDFTKRADKLEKLSEEAEAALGKKLDAPMKAAQKKLNEQMIRVMTNPELQEVLEPILAKLGE